MPCARPHASPCGDARNPASGGLYQTCVRQAKELRNRHPTATLSARRWRSGAGGRRAEGGAPRCPRGAALSRGRRATREAPRKRRCPRSAGAKALGQALPRRPRFCPASGGLSPPVPRLNPILECWCRRKRPYSATRGAFEGRLPEPPIVPRTRVVRTRRSIPPQPQAAPAPTRTRGSPPPCSGLNKPVFSRTNLSGWDWIRCTTTRRRRTEEAPPESSSLYARGRKRQRHGHQRHMRLSIGVAEPARQYLEASIIAAAGAIGRVSRSLIRRLQKPPGGRLSGFLYRARHPRQRGGHEKHGADAGALAPIHSRDASLAKIGRSRRPRTPPRGIPESPRILGFQRLRTESQVNGLRMPTSSSLTVQAGSAAPGTGLTT